MPVLVRRVLAFGLTWILLGGSLGTAQADQSIAPSEYQVKAAFIYKFASYVQWPAASPGNAARPFTIGILGEDPFGPSFEEIVRGQKVGQRPVRLVRFADVDDFTQCDILFISASEQLKVRRILATLRGAPVLTVADMDGFAERGGMINLTNEGKRIRFAINVAAIEHARLKAASQLLRLATIVHGSPETR